MTDANGDVPSGELNDNYKIANFDGRPHLQLRAFDEFPEPLVFLITASSLGDALSEDMSATNYCDEDSNPLSLNDDYDSTVILDVHKNQGV